MPSIYKIRQQYHFLLRVAIRYFVTGETTAQTSYLFYKPIPRMVAAFAPAFLAVEENRDKLAVGCI